MRQIHIFPAANPYFSCSKSTFSLVASFPLLRTIHGGKPPGSKEAEAKKEAESDEEDEESLEQITVRRCLVHWFVTVRSVVGTLLLSAFYSIKSPFTEILLPHSLKSFFSLNRKLTNQ
jgi:hypothetical protein